MRSSTIATLDALLQRRGMTLTELSERVDLTLANLSILKTGKAGAIRFSTFEAICRELECRPGTCSAISNRGGRAVDRSPAKGLLKHWKCVHLSMPAASGPGCRAPIYLAAKINNLTSR